MTILSRPSQKPGWLSAGLPLFLLLVFLSGLALGQERFRKSPPLPDPLQALRLPNIETLRLSNGLTLSTAFREGIPLFSLHLLVQSGESSSPPNIPGLASFTANMIPRQTRLLSTSDIEETIESIGGDLTVTTTYDYSLFSFTFLEDQLDQALELMSQMILQPLFIEREIENVRRTMFYDLFGREKDPEFVARRHLLRRLFQAHPSQGAFFGSDVLKNIKQKDILDFFSSFYRPNNAHIILAGNINLRTAARKVSHFFNTWTPAELKHAPLPPPAPREELRISFVDVPGASECTIVLGNFAPSMKSPDFFPFFVFHQVLGGTPNSRLFLNLRESKAYAYYAFSEIMPFTQFSIFLIRARVTPEVTFPSVQEILLEIRKNLLGRILPSEIEQAKSSLIGNFPLDIESLDRFSAHIARLMAHGLEEEFWSKYYESLMLVSSERVLEACQRLAFLTPEIVIAGDKKILLKHLEAFDKVDVFDEKGILQFTLLKESKNETSGMRPQFQ